MFETIMLKFVTKPTLVITRVRMLYFTRQYKDTLRMRLVILMLLFIQIN